MTAHRLALSLLILLPYALFGLAPTGLLDFPEVLRNHARSGDGGTIEFPGFGIVGVPGGGAWLDSAVRNNRFDIGLRVKPSSNRATGPARILTSSLDPAERNLTIGQNFDNLIVRVRRPGIDINGMPDIVVPDVFAAGRWVDIGVTFDGNELRILVNGKQAERVPVGPGGLRSWSADYKMALGNELTLDRPWLGSIQRANISAGNLRLDLLARENHDNPFFIFRAPSGDYGRNVDIAVNLLGFIPLGVVLALAFRPMRWPIFVLLILAVVSVSGGIETTQLALPSRTPSLLDFELNVLGGVAGLLLATLLTQRRRTRRFRPAPEGAD